MADSDSSSTDSASASSGGSDGGSPTPPPPKRRPGTGRPARSATGRGDSRIAVASSALRQQATGRGKSTPEATAERDARREASIAAAFEALVTRGGFEHTVLLGWGAWGEPWGAGWGGGG